MRIAIDCRMVLNRPTGIGTYVINLVQNLLKIDQSNEYFLYINQGSLLQNERMPLNGALNRVNIPPLSLREQLRFGTILNKAAYDIVHIPAFNIPYNLRSPSVITIHDLIHLKHAAGYSRHIRAYFETVVRYGLKKASLIVTDSENSRQDIVAWTHRPPPDVRAIPLGAADIFHARYSGNDVDTIKNKLNIKNEFILFNGSKKPQKNVLGTVAAFKQCREKFARPLTLVLVGVRDARSKETNFDEIIATVHELKLEDSVLFAGCLDDTELAIVYQAASLLIFPSFYEGFGLPALEAMSCGCPVVVSNTSSLPEVCGDAAEYVNPQSVESITGGILNVLTNPDLRSRMITKGFQRAKLFSWEKCARETLAVYKEAHQS